MAVFSISIFVPLQVLALLAGYIFFLLRVPAEQNALSCMVAAVLTHYFLLAAYFWSVLFAIEILRTVRSLYAVNQRSKAKIAK